MPMPIELELDVLLFLKNGLAAILAGFLMGLERQLKGKHAGLKTNVLVALGANVFIMASLVFADFSGTDLSRVLGQVIVGVGFLGAGVILPKNGKDKVAGLATAATIWCSAAAGCLAGLGLYAVLGVFTIMVVLVNLVFGLLNRKIDKKKSAHKE